MLKPGQIWYNNPQLAVKLSSRIYKIIIGGRGIGKTTIFADEIERYRRAMPRSKLVFGGLTYFHLKTRSMPAIIAQWERMGYKRDRDYYFGHRAPAKVRKGNAFRDPHIPPLDWSQSIHWYDGTAVDLLSFDRPEMARSTSADGLFLDEAAKLNKYAIDNDVRPILRGNDEHFGHVRFHGGYTFATTQPLTPEGEWVWEFEKLMEENPWLYFFMEASAEENRKVLGDKYFRHLKRTLPPVVYDLEILNKRPNFGLTSFYPLLSEANLYSDSFDYNYYERIEWDLGSKGGQTCLGDKDYNRKAHLDISFDFGSRFNSLVVGQEIKSAHEFRLINNFFAENKKLKDVVDQFVRYYEAHPEKQLIVYGGSDGNKRTDAKSRVTYFEYVLDLLRKAGWNCHLVARNSEIENMDKHLFWNLMLSGELPVLPTFKINQNNAYETYVSMKNTELKPNTFKKNKNPESDENLPQWKAGHLGDAADNLVYWKYKGLTIGSSTPGFDINIF